MSDWRAMNSLLVLRDQVNVIAPNRSKASDGLVGDASHSSSSGHYPHYVAGVGSDIVTALDLTHDPANGCDTYELAEQMRLARDKRIRYVISNGRIFSSYASGSRPAWTWGPYTGSPDPHINHSHTQVLDDPIADTTTEWDLGEFDMALTEAEHGALGALDNRMRALAKGEDTVTGTKFFQEASGETMWAVVALKRIEATLKRIEEAIAALPAGGGGSVPANVPTALENAKATVSELADTLVRGGA